ncbi:tpr domain containing protein [Plakobranchus ocellatus]|uniref:Tpr domain containing protein n=1 Tax=Plakobranchus ocellatus TaxID=259542 RepID=A0AAV4DF06_9GAST|nr:tpr domain containing protein [Plakobranchus ocellatus]
MVCPLDLTSFGVNFSSCNDTQAKLLSPTLALRSTVGPGCSQTRSGSERAPPDEGGPRRHCIPQQSLSLSECLPLFQIRLLQNEPEDQSEACAYLNRPVCRNQCYRSTGFSRFLAASFYGLYFCERVRATPLQWGAPCGMCCYSRLTLGSRACHNRGVTFPRPLSGPPRNRRRLALSRPVTSLLLFTHFTHLSWWLPVFARAQCSTIPKRLAMFYRASERKAKRLFSMDFIDRLIGIALLVLTERKRARYLTVGTPCRRQIVVGALLQASDSNGDILQVSNSSGSTVQAIDSSGDTMQASDSSGDTLLASDSSGDTVQVSDSNGDILQASDSNADILQASDSNGGCAGIKWQSSKLIFYQLIFTMSIDIYYFFKN